ncbi:putative membrane protein [Bordetella holmesii 41130]|nr:putative membrane protein [Bordetella holmesii 41130]EWM49987.1 putative membrane protein [Bordetella holmesii 35009]
MGKILFWFIAILVILTGWRMLNARNSRRAAPPGAAPRRLWPNPLKPWCGAPIAASIYRARRPCCKTARPGAASSTPGWARRDRQAANEPA